MQSTGGIVNGRASRLAAAILIVFVMVACDKNSTATPPAGNKPPVAAFTLTPAEGAAPLAVSVDAGGSTDPDGRITGYAWEFGDGAKATGVTASHTYSVPGKHTVTLTVTDDKGATDQRQATVTVTAPPANQAPTAAFSVTPESGAAPLEVELDASASSDPDGSITAYAWDFGDGASGDGVAVNHTYGEPGEYTITLTVTDDDGATAKRTATVNVTAGAKENQLPIAAFYVTPETGGEAPLTVEVDATPSKDPDGSIAGYVWDFGGGASASGRSASHTFTTPGEHTITLTVTDNEGASASSSQSVTVTEPTPKNQPPVASFTATPHAGFVPLEVAFDASASADPDGSITSYAWDFGDGATASGAQVTHTYTEAGHYTATLTVTDDEGATASHSYAVTAQPKLNVAPVAEISATALSGLPGLTVTFDASGSYDPDGSILSYEWHIGGRWDYTGPVITHTFEETGSFSVFLTVYDDKGYPGTKSVEVLIYSGDYNLPPNAEFTATPNHGEAPLVVEFDASASFDYDGSIVAYEWDFGDGAVGSGVRATHTYEAAGEYSVTLTVTDDAGDRANRHTIISVTPAPGETTVDPLFTLGIVAGGDIVTSMRGEAAMSFLAGGNLEARNLTLSAGNTARAAGTFCQLHDGPCEAGVEPPAVPSPDFSSLRALVIEEVLATYRATDLAEVCDHYGGVGAYRTSVDGRVVCLDPSQVLEIREDVTDLIVIGDETTEVRFLRGTIGSETGTVVILTGSITAGTEVTFLGDTTLITVQVNKGIGATFLSNNSGARPLIAIEDDITIYQIGETHALVWTGGTFRTAGDRSELIGIAVAVGDYVGGGSADMTYAMPDTVENPYLPRVPAY